MFSAALPAYGNMRDVILNHFLDVLVSSDYNKAKTARELGISQRTVRNYVEQLTKDGYKFNQYKEDRFACRDLADNETRLYYADHKKRGKYEKVS